MGVLPDQVAVFRPSGGQCVCHNLCDGLGRQSSLPHAGEEGPKLAVGIPVQGFSLGRVVLTQVNSSLPGFIPDGRLDAPDIEQ